MLLRKNVNFVQMGNLLIIIHRNVLHVQLIINTIKVPMFADYATQQLVSFMMPLLINVANVLHRSSTTQLVDNANHAAQPNSSITL
jgi:hypothetical protein